MFAVAANEVFNGVLTVGAIVGGVAYALGQLLSSRKRGGNDALRIAIDEVDAIKIRADRLEKEGVVQQGRIHELEKENGLLRSMVGGNGKMADALFSRLDEAFTRQTRRLVDVVRKELDER